MLRLSKYVIDDIYRAYERAAELFVDNLQCPEAQRYIRKRGLTQESVANFRIGYAPEVGDFLTTLLAQEFDLHLLEKARLISIPTQIYGDEYFKGPHDCFWKRLMLPRLDSQGRVLGFAGRTTDPELQSGPRYITTPWEFSTECIYGLHLALEEITRLGFAIVTEGEIDVIMAHQKWLKNTIQFVNMPPNKEKIRRLKGIVKRIWICYDNDKPGRDARIKAEKAFAEEGIETKIIRLSGCKDLDKFLRHRTKEDFYQLAMDQQR